MDEVAIYNTALTPEMIPAYYYVAQSDGVLMTITRFGGNVTIQWPVGTLQQADTLTGAWTDVSGANPPSHTTAATVGAQKFYRIKP